MSQRASDMDDKKINAAMEELRKDLQAAAEEEWVHPAYEELEGYVDGTLDGPDHENVESHLEVCLECSASERELRALQQDLNTASQPSRVIPFSRTAWWKFAAAAAVLIVVSSLAMLSMRNRMTGLEAQVKTLQEEKAILEKQSQDAGPVKSGLENRGLAPEQGKLIAEVLA